MKILHVMASGAQGGGAEHVLNLLCYLRNFGIIGDAAISDDGPLLESLKAHQFNTHVLNLMQSRLNFHEVCRLQRLLGRYDIAHLHGTRAAFYNALALPKSTTPSVYTIHGLSYRKENLFWRKHLFMRAEQLACRKSDQVISVSKTDLGDLWQRRLLSPYKGVYIPNAIDFAKFTQGDRITARKLLHIPPDGVVIGSTMRLVEQKAPQDLILAFRQLHPAQAILSIIGDGPLRSQCEHLARGHQVQFLGIRDDVAMILPAFDIFALASRWEGEPIALLEAMAAGLPCVATATTGAQEIVSHGKNALLAPIGDIDAIAKHLQNLLRNSLLRRALGNAAQNDVRRRSHTVQAQQVRDIYINLLRRRAS